MTADTLLTRDILLETRSWLTRWLGSPSEAEDVIQSVGAKLASRDEAPSKAYLSAMFRTAAIDAVRASRTRRGYESTFASEAECVELKTPERHAAAEQALQALEGALRSLGRLDREIFLRAHVSEQSRKEIADALGLKLSTIEKRLARARRHCLAYLAPHTGR
ncbi:MAG: sigma-70 family RNA polymerase sigma factor [Pseudomonadota bacterium]